LWVVGIVVLFGGFIAGVVLSLTGYSL
jgi:hypothetical protein